VLYVLLHSRLTFPSWPAFKVLLDFLIAKFTLSLHLSFPFLCLPLLYTCRSGQRISPAMTFPNLVAESHSLLPRKRSVSASACFRCRGSAWSSKNSMDCAGRRPLNRSCFGSRIRRKVVAFIWGNSDGSALYIIRRRFQSSVTPRNYRCRNFGRKVVSK